MKKFLVIGSIIGLALTVIPSFFVLYGIVSWTSHAQLMFAGMVFWFLTAPFWMKSKQREM